MLTSGSVYFILSFAVIGYFSYEPVMRGLSLKLEVKNAVFFGDGDTPAYFTKWSVIIAISIWLSLIPIFGGAFIVLIIVGILKMIGRIKDNTHIQSIKYSVIDIDRLHTLTVIVLGIVAGFVFLAVGFMLQFPYLVVFGYGTAYLLLGGFFFSTNVIALTPILIISGNYPVKFVTGLTLVIYFFAMALSSPVSWGLINVSALTVFGLIFLLNAAMVKFAVSGSTATPTGTGNTPYQNQNADETVLTGQPVQTNVNRQSQSISGLVKSVTGTLMPDNVIGLVGPPTSGKTTFFSFFVKFLPDMTSRIGVSASIEEGHEILQAHFDEILTEGKFPTVTAESYVGQVEISFSSKKKMGSKKVVLRMNDIGGETFNKLKGGANNVRKMMVGTPYEYLLHSKGYIFMIDCSSYQNWTSDDLNYARILSSLMAARPRKKSSIPIAFVFTKSDLLPDAVFNYSASELFNSLRETSSYVNAHFSSPVAFKIFIRTERNEQGEIVPKIDVTQGGRKEILYDQTVNSGFLELANWVCEIGGLL